MRGFSLVEIVVAIGILSMIILAFDMITNSSYKIFRYNQNELSSLNKAATIMRDFERTTRGASSFESNTANTLIFLAYQKGDTHPAPSKISYYFTDNTLNKSVIPPVLGTDGKYTYTDETNKKVTTFAGEVTTHDIFTYSDENSVQLTGTIQSASIRMIKINVTVDGKVPATETTAVQLRNLKTNL